MVEGYSLFRKSLALKVSTSGGACSREKETKENTTIGAA